MWIQSLRIENYKSFADSGLLEFGPGFNFILGKNNSGKTALLEAFRLDKNTPMPHRDATYTKNAAVSPRSAFDVIISIDAREAFEAIGAVNQILIPVQHSGTNSPNIIVEEIFKTKGVKIQARYVAGRGYEGIENPSHGRFKYVQNETKLYSIISPTEDRRNYQFSEARAGGTDSLIDLFHLSFLRKKVFVFSAERTRNSEVEFMADGVLVPDARNLPRALFEMERRPILWERFNSLVNEILPNVRRVVNVASGANLITKLWPVDPETDRDDLIVSLSDSGSGVGQVLSILCAALTFDQAVICIDEPGNFLHPGAVKSLMRILSQYNHQYIISTHSLEALSAVPADQVYFIEWDNGVSKAQKVSAAGLDDNRKLLADLGISVSDIFGVERVVWVEGQTEEHCLPAIIQAALGHMPANMAVLRVRSVDELIRRQGREAVILDIYRRLTEAGGLIPRQSKFLFDREERSEDYIQSVSDQTRGLVHFLPRRTFENYLINVECIFAELREERERLGVEGDFALDMVDNFIADNRNRFAAKGSGGALEDRIDAPKLLKDMFWKFGKIEYKKTQHSPSITRRLIAAGDPAIGELIEYVRRNLLR